MAFYLFLLFTVVPLVELAGLVWLGGQTAWWVPILRHRCRRRAPARR